VDRLFLDANILFSASYREDAGVSALWSVDDVRLLSSTYAIEEAKRNLVERGQKKRLERLIQKPQVFESATAPQTIRGAVDLPAKDLPILGGAVAAEATHLITGDLKHFGPWLGKQIHGILVLPPAHYLRARIRTF
jgi:uncharacterized protein